MHTLFGIVITLLVLDIAAIILVAAYRTSAMSDADLFFE